MTRFEGRVAVVTGAAQGIGAATARRLAGEGASVAVVDVNESAAAETAAEITDGGGTAHAFRCDVSDSADVDGLFKAVTDRFDTVHILVNNAGVTRDNLLFKMTDDDWDAVIGTHLKGSFLCSRAAQRSMVEQRYGKIVMLSSRAALGNRGQTNYSSAKAGLQGMTRTMAIELGPFGINVNCVAPGHVDTAMTRSVAERTGVSYDEVKEATIKMNAIKRVGTTEDIASAIAFLASDEAGYITGQVLYITGRPTV